MPRLPRLDYPRACHLASIEVEGSEPAFAAPDNCVIFLEILKNTLARHALRCHGYLLLDNRARLLLESLEGRLSAGMGVISRQFVTLLQRERASDFRLRRRFHSILFEKNRYLLPLNRFMVLEPVRSRAVKWPDDHPWSSFRSTCGQAPIPAFLYVRDILSRLAPSHAQAKPLYSEYVDKGLTGPMPFDPAHPPRFLGHPDFVATHRAMARHPHDAEHPKQDPPARKKTLGRLFRNRNADREARNRTIAEACLVHGHSRRAVARHLGLAPSTITRILQAMSQATCQEGADPHVPCKS